MADLRVRTASGLRTASAFTEFGALWCGLATGPVMRAAGYMGSRNETKSVFAPLTPRKENCNDE